MVKEAIEAVKEAEAQANIILQEANKASRNLRREAEILAEEKYQQIMEEAQREANAMKEKALAEGEFIGQTIVEKGIKESEKLIALSHNRLDKAVNIIIERIVNTNGDS